MSADQPTSHCPKCAKPVSAVDLTCRACGTQTSPYQVGEVNDRAQPGWSGRSPWLLFAVLVICSINCAALFYILTSFLNPHSQSGISALPIGFRLLVVAALIAITSVVARIYFHDGEEDE